jgi:hypothetical protein
MMISKKKLGYVRFVRNKDNQSNLEIKSSIIEAICSNRCNGYNIHCNGLIHLYINVDQKASEHIQPLTVVTDPLTVVTVDIEINFSENKATSVITDPYIRCNKLNHLCTNFIQKAPEHTPLLSVVTDLSSVTTINLARVSTA